MNDSLSYVTGYAPGCNTSIGDRLTVVILFHHGLHDRLLGLCLFAAVDTLLHVPQLVVLAFLGKQLIVRAAFHDLAVIHHKDQITVTNSGQAVSYDQHGTICKLIVDHVEDQIFRSKVQITGGFIQNVEVGIFQESACQRNALLFTAGQAVARFFQIGVILQGQMTDKVVSPSWQLP